MIAIRPHNDICPQGNVNCWKYVLVESLLIHWGTGTGTAQTQDVQLSPPPPPPPARVSVHIAYCWKSYTGRFGVFHQVLAAVWFEHVVPSILYIFSLYGTLDLCRNPNHLQQIATLSRKSPTYQTRK